MMAASKVQEEMEQAAQKVNTYLDSRVPKKEPERLTLAARHLLLAGGKRLRPLITIKSCELEGGTESQALPMACAVELLHNFTLIHDDIMDRDATRRNVKTVHVVYGEPTAILAGDYLFAKAFETSSSDMANVSPESLVRANGRLAEAMSTLAEGQAFDTEFELRDKVTENEYIEMVRMKTASLYAASAYVGGCIGGGGEDDLIALDHFGDALGIAFQIKDDILGLVGDLQKLGKPIGSDLQKGKKTLIILKGLEELPSTKRQRVLQLMHSQKGAPSEVRHATELLLDTGAKAYAELRMREYARKAITSLKQLPQNDAKNLLEACVNFVVERSY